MNFRLLFPPYAYAKAITWLIKKMSTLWEETVQEHGHPTDTDVSHHNNESYAGNGYDGLMLKHGVVPTYKGAIPEPLVVVYDYITQTFQNGYKQNWITGRDHAGTYYAVKLNPDIGVVELGDRSDYVSWLDRYLYHYQHV